jgi:hypothetical protein
MLASGVMAAGVTPFILCVVWTRSILDYASEHKGEVGGSDIYVVSAALFFTYAFAVIVSGYGMLWSAALEHKLGKKLAYIRCAKIAICIILLIPIFWLMKINIVDRF